MLFQKIQSRFSSIFIQSLSETYQALLNNNVIQEFNPSLTEDQKLHLKRFLIYRYNPSDPQDNPKFVSYYVDISQFAPMYLDAILYIKDNMDSTLSLRRSCREGICGSCAINGNGLHTLACINAFDQDLTKPEVISPLGHMFVIKDLVVDMTQFYNQYKFIKPYLMRKDVKTSNKEYIQTIEDRKKLDGLYECVLCACCTTSCPSYWWTPDKYIGPAILQQAYRWIIDSRDQYTNERIEQLMDGATLNDCQQIGMCTVTCPKGLNPQQSLKNLLEMIKDMKKNKVSDEIVI